MTTQPTFSIAISITFGLVDPRDNQDSSQAAGDVSLPRAGYQFVSEEFAIPMNACQYPYSPDRLTEILEDGEAAARRAVEQNPDNPDLVNRLICAGAAVGTVIAGVGTVLSGGVAAPLTGPLAVKLLAGSGFYCSVYQLMSADIPDLFAWLSSEGQRQVTQVQAHTTQIDAPAKPPLIICGQPRSQIESVNCGDKFYVPIPVTFLGLYPGEFVPHIIFTFYPEEGPQKKAAEWAIPYPKDIEPDNYSITRIPPYVTGKHFRKRIFRNKVSLHVFAKTEQEATRIGLLQEGLIDPVVLENANEPTCGQVGIRPESKKTYEPKAVYLKYVTAYLGGVDGACEGWDWSWRYDIEGRGSQRL